MSTVNNLLIYNLQRQFYSQVYPKSLRIVTETRNVPPTTITLYKNGEVIDLAQNNITMTTAITNRRYSYYYTTSLLHGNPPDLVGSYEFSVGNDRVMTNMSLPTINGKYST